MPDTPDVDALVDVVRQYIAGGRNVMVTRTEAEAALATLARKQLSTISPVESSLIVADTPDVDALVADVEDGLYRMAGHNAWAALRELATLARKATPPHDTEFCVIEEGSGECMTVHGLQDAVFDNGVALSVATANIEALTARAEEAEAMCEALRLRNEELQCMVDAGLERSSEAAQEAVK